MLGYRVSCTQRKSLRTDKWHGVREKPQRLPIQSQTALAAKLWLKFSLPATIWFKSSIGQKARN